MVLKRATKSIPLVGGIVEEVDDFLIEPTGMQYMENLRYTKTDRAEKARPRGDGVVTGVVNYHTAVNGFWADDKDNVHVIGNNEVCSSYDGGLTWSTASQNSDILGIDKLVSTTEIPNATNWTWAPIGAYNSGATPDTYTITGYLVACQLVKIDASLNTSVPYVRVMVYDTDGILQFEEQTVNRMCPRVQPYSSGAYLWNVSTSGTLYAYAVPYTNLTGLNSLGTSALGIQTYCQVYNRTDKAYGTVSSTLKFEETRLGYTGICREDQNGALCVHNTYDSLVGALAYKDESAGDIMIQKLLLGVPNGTAAAVYSDVTPGAMGKVLDVQYDGANDEAWVLYQLTNTTGGVAQSDLRASCWDMSASPPTNIYDYKLNTVSPENGIYINGGIRFNGTYVWAAATFAHGEINESCGITQGKHRVQWFKYTKAGTVQDGNSVYSHRMVSNLELDKTGNPYCVVQQWDNWNPGSAGADLAVPLITPTHQKPVTSILLRLTRHGVTGSDHEPCATFDPGQSKGCLPAMDEQSIHWSGNLYYWDQGDATPGAHQFWYGNTNLLNAQDSFYFESLGGTPGAIPDSAAKTPLSMGSSRMNVYHMRADLDIHQARFTTGLFMGAAIPTWHDGGKELVEIAPFDSPEIVGVAGTGDGASYLTYNDPSLAGAGPKVVQVCTLFYDDAGRVHRSAPSVPVYVGELIDADNDDEAVCIYFTAPLSINKDRPYAVEVYEALPGNDPQLAHTEFINNSNYGNADNREFLWYYTNREPYASTYDLAEYRSGKTIYTAGNVLAADPWPNLKGVVDNGKRLFARSISDPAAIYYSKIYENGITPEFSASLVLNIGNEDITAIGAIDDKVIAFTRSSMYLIYGTGPDNTGANGDFFIEKMTFPHGCTEQESIVNTDEGIFFLSSTTQEFCVLGRDMQLVDIGENVKDMSQGITKVRQAIVEPMAHQIRWYVDHTTVGDYAVDNGTTPKAFLQNNPGLAPTFVYNFKYKKWSIFDDISNGTMRACISNNDVCILSSSYTFFRENDSDWRYSDLCTWETPWIKVNQLQDYGRFYGATLLGKYLSSWTDNGSGTEAGDLYVDVAYDYEADFVDTYIFRAQQDLVATQGDRLQLRVRPKRQKCQAIKFRFREVASEKIELHEPTYATGRGFILTALDLHYGAKGGSGDKSVAARRRKG